MAPLILIIVNRMSFLGNASAYVSDDASNAVALAV